MLFYLFALVAFLKFVWPNLSYLLPAVFPVKQQEESAKHSQPSSSEDDDVAEVDGGVWKQLSIFEHVELGLKRNPDGPAVTCLFRPGADLEELVGARGNIQDEHHSNGYYFAGNRENGHLDRSRSRSNGTTTTTRESSPGGRSTSSSLWNHQQHVTTPLNGFNGSYFHDRSGNGINGISGHKEQQLDKRHGLWAKAYHNGTNGPAMLSPTLRRQSDQQVFHLTYRQLHTSALRLSAGLLSNGVRPESTMLMLIPNGGEYAVLLWTCILLRITYVSVDPSSLDIAGFTSLKHTLQSLKPQIVVAPDATSGRAIDVAMSELGLPQPYRLCLSKPPPESPWKSLATVASEAHPEATAETTKPETETTATTLIQSAKQDRFTRIHCIFFTSGTSGTPKGCPLTVGGMSHDLHSQSWLLDSESGTSNFALQQAHNSRAICPLQMLQTWRAGGSVLMTERGLRVDDAARAICGNHNYRATFIVLSPPMVHELAAELGTWRDKPDVSSVKRIQLGGDVVTKDMLAKCATMFPQAQVCINHGMSEGPGMFSWPFFNTHISEIPFFGEMCPIGRAAPGSLVRIWDADKKCVVKRGQLGELHVSRGSVIRSYWAGRAAESFHEESSGKGRWFNTGDIGMVNKDGLIFILGRKKDMIRRAGVGIMPAAIESCIDAFTGAQTIVVPVAHHVLGSEPFAVLASYNGKRAKDIKEHVKASLGKDYALGGLASLEQLGLSQFPVNATHKVMKDKVQIAVEQYLKKKGK